MRSSTLICTALGLTFVFVSPVRADTFTFSALPQNGTIAVLPGQTMGWGYSLTNNSTNLWLVTMDLNATTFLFGTGDASPFDFPALPPGGSVTVKYDPSVPAGLYAYTAFKNAPVGSKDFASFTLTAQFWTNDPANGGMFASNAPDQTVNVLAVITPEPRSEYLLLSAGVLILGAAWRRRYQTKAGSVVGGQRSMLH